MAGPEADPFSVVNDDDDEEDDELVEKDEPEEDDPVGKMRSPRWLNFNFIQPGATSVVSLAPDGPTDWTSFLTLAKNLEAHWFNCG